MSSSSKYSSEQIEQYRAQFAELDTDGSGELDEGELLAALTKLGATATEDEARKMIREADLNDRASSETDWGIELRTRDRQRKLMSKIDSALRRIEQGEYGYCQKKSPTIGLARRRRTV